MPKAPAPNRVKSMNELLKGAEMAETAISPPRALQRLVLLQFSRMRAFKDHPFRLYVGERLADMVESIRQNGILLPLIVRRIYDDPDYDYEILSGHNRVNAATIAGLTEAWCVVKENLSDEDALMYVIETNLIQRSFAELLPSEKAAVLSLRYSKMFSQGKRNDIAQELAEMEGAATCGTEFHKSREALGDEYSLTGRQVAKYLRIHTLIPELKSRVDDHEFTLAAAVEISYIPLPSQEMLHNLLQQIKVKITDGKAKEIRAVSASEQPEKQLIQILNGAPGNERPLRSVSIGYSTYGKYFPTGTPKKEIEKTIGQALELFFSKTGKEGRSA